MNKPVLESVTVEITNHCQLHCQHCGIWREKARHELNSSMVVRMLRELLERYRVHAVSITGGEPFLNRHCGRLLKALSFFRERGAIRGFGVYSNGACFEGVRRVVTVYGDYLHGMELGISIDGRKETHDRLRGEGSYQKTIKTVSWLAKNLSQDIVLEFKFTINHLNYAELGDVYRLAQRFKARFSPKIMEAGVNHYYHRHPMPGAAKMATLTEDMVECVQGQIKQILNDGYPGVDGPLVQALMTLLTDGRKCISACATPAKTLFINSRRNVYPCLYLPPVGKVGTRGELPEDLDLGRKKHADNAAQGDCPGCYAYHGFLKKFNLAYLDK